MVSLNLTSSSYPITIGLPGETCIKDSGLREPSNSRCLQTSGCWFNLTGLNRRHRLVRRLGSIACAFLAYKSPIVTRNTRKTQQSQTKSLL